MTPLILISISSTVIVIATVSTVVTVLFMKPSENSSIMPNSSNIIMNSSSTASPSTPASPVNSGTWQDWATTTVYGGPDDLWPNIIGGTNLYLNPTISARLNSYSTTAAAIPWNFICGGYGTRAAWINAIIASAKGLGGTTKPCYKIQPIKESIFPDTIKGMFCPENPSCIDINDDSLAKFDNGTMFPEFLVIPYSGCGGDCGVLTDGSYNHHDCVNGCDGIGSWIYNCMAPQGSAPSNCGSVYAMANNNWNASIYLPLLKSNGSEAIGYNVSISPQTNYGRNMGALWDNWCTGQNMHFDVVLPIPWADYMTGGNNSNIRVRWRPAACNDSGVFDPSNVPTNSIGTV